MWNENLISTTAFCVFLFEGSPMPFFAALITRVRHSFVYLLPRLLHDVLSLDTLFQIDLLRESPSSPNELKKATEWQRSEEKRMVGFFYGKSRISADPCPRRGDMEQVERRKP
jgi:hypothetical protein